MTSGDADSLVDALRELVAAIDRRIPHLERAGEEAIARDAAALKEAALRRIAECSTTTDTGARAVTPGQGRESDDNGA
ncbi:MAG TPA: hypothetical protein VG871_03550 [Vicinamibacterales bacterium]|nr:hypothetical protein [Vicinamibacterales bacterium]